MAATFYKLNFVYPDGHIEEIDEYFRDLEKAKNYGEQLMIQVANTEQFHGGHKGKPYFMVYEVADGQNSLVFESKH